MIDFEIKRGDRLPIFEATLRDADKASVDLTNADTVRLILKRGSTIYLDKAMTVDPAQDQDDHKGKVTYVWGDGDTNTKGQYNGEIEVTFTGGKKQTFPTHGYMTVVIAADLG